MSSSMNLNNDNFTDNVTGDFTDNNTPTWAQIAQGYSPPQVTIPKAADPPVRSKKQKTISPEKRKRLQDKQDYAEMANQRARNAETDMVEALAKARAEAQKSTLSSPPSQTTQEESVDFGARAGNTPGQQDSHTSIDSEDLATALRESEPVPPEPVPLETVTFARQYHYITETGNYRCRGCESRVPGNLRDMENHARDEHKRLLTLPFEALLAAPAEGEDAADNAVPMDVVDNAQPDSVEEAVCFVCVWPAYRPAKEVSKESREKHAKTCPNDKCTGQEHDPAYACQYVGPAGTCNELCKSKQEALRHALDCHGAPAAHNGKIIKPMKRKTSTPSPKPKAEKKIDPCAARVAEAIVEGKTQTPDAETTCYTVDHSGFEIVMTHIHRDATVISMGPMTAIVANPRFNDPRPNKWRLKSKVCERSVVPLDTGNQAVQQYREFHNAAEMAELQGTLTRDTDEFCYMKLPVPVEFNCTKSQLSRAVSVREENGTNEAWHKTAGKKIYSVVVVKPLSVVAWHVIRCNSMKMLHKSLKELYPGYAQQFTTLRFQRTQTDELNDTIVKDQVDSLFSMTLTGVRNVTEMLDIPRDVVNAWMRYLDFDASEANSGQIHAVYFLLTVAQKRIGMCCEPGEFGDLLPPRLDGTENADARCEQFKYLLRGIDDRSSFQDARASVEAFLYQCGGIKLVPVDLSAIESNCAQGITELVRYDAVRERQEAGAVEGKMDIATSRFTKSLSKCLREKQDDGEVLVEDDVLDLTEEIVTKEHESWEMPAFWISNLDKAISMIFCPIAARMFEEISEHDKILLELRTALEKANSTNEANAAEKIEQDKKVAEMQKQIDTMNQFSFHKRSSARIAKRKRDDSN